jgi:hypothetical protein
MDDMLEKHAPNEIDGDQLNLLGKKATQVMA